MSLSEKYFVIKNDDWFDLVRDGVITDQQAIQIEGAFLTGGHFVVREQDVFAPAGLYAYAANIRTTLEVLDTLPLGGLGEEQRRSLLELADNLADTADKWQAGETMKKLPD